jgi:hypothetical protein
MVPVMVRTVPCTFALHWLCRGGSLLVLVAGQDGNTGRPGFIACDCPCHREEVMRNDRP